MITREQQLADIKEVLEAISPFIQADGGDIEFVELTEDGIVKLRLHGACVGCGLADVTIYQGVEQALVEEVEGVKGVELIQDNWFI